MSERLKTWRDSDNPFDHGRQTETDRGYAAGNAGRHSRFRMGIVISYICMVLMACLLIAGAILTSALTIANDQNAFVDIAGTYTISQLQQNAIRQGIQTLADHYHFGPTTIDREISVAALSQFSQSTAEYWYGMLHGSVDTALPVWETGALYNAVLSDEVFRQSWTANEQEDKAQEAAQKIGEEIQTSISPLQPATMAALFTHIVTLKYLEKALYLDIGILLALLIVAAIMTAAQRKYPFYHFWFLGVSALTGAMGTGIVVLQMQNQTLQDMLSRYSDILSFFGASVLSVFIKGLKIFGAVYLLLGAVMLILFFAYRYQYFHKTHHELSSLI